MSIFSKLKGWIMNFFTTQAKDTFNIQTLTSDRMEAAQARWYRIIEGRPDWITEDGDIRSINFAEYVCAFLAKKACLDLKITVQGSERADYINDVLTQAVQKSLRDKVEDALGLGGIIIKPNGTYNPEGALDFILPGWFAVTDTNTNGDILGAVFIDRRIKGDRVYSRIEYHHFLDDGLYEIDQKAFVSRSRDAIGREIPLTEVPEWADLQPELKISNVEKPLFAYFKCPAHNNIDFSSPEGCSIFANAINELENLDIAWSQKRNETADSTHITFIDEAAVRTKPDRDHPQGGRIKLPRFVQGIRQGVDGGQTVTEHVPTMLTANRLADINSILSMISSKVGCSQGQFTLDRKSGVITATQVESDDRETIETITDIRNALKSAIKQLVYALDKYCDAFFQMPSGYINALDVDVADEDIFYFKDLQATFEQDRARAYQLMTLGVYSKKRYLIEYEGFTSEEAEAMLQEAQDEKAQSTASTLFGMPTAGTAGKPTGDTGAAGAAGTAEAAEAAGTTGSGSGATAKAPTAPTAPTAPRSTKTRATAPTTASAGK